MRVGRIGSVVILVGVGLASSCGGGAGGGTGTGGGAGSNGTGGTGGTSACKGLPIPAQSCLSTTFTALINNEIDILFMIDNSSSMSEMQQKLYAQIPTFMNVLQNAPTAPSLHVAVVSSDLGAPGDSTTSTGCTSAGDQGQFQSTPRSNTTLNITCTDTTLADGATFISDADMMPNYTNPDISQVLQCIALLGDKGCGFEHQLASIDRALGADNIQNGVPNPPASNANFLRPEAYLGIVILTNEDDCSAPANTQLYSLNGGSQNIANPLGPIAKYRCNQFGHICTDPNGNMISPPLNPPADAMGTAAAPTLDLTSCVSNDAGSGLLTPVSQFVNDIKALKSDPDNQIVVAAITGPPAPYTVAWVPEEGGQNTEAGELWPQIEHSCGAAGADDVNPESTMSPTDGSVADPGVRISQFVRSFNDSVLASICDASYASAMKVIATKIGQLITPFCITQTIQADTNDTPDCLVVENVENNNVYQRTTIPNCATNNNAAPCWQLAVGGGSCAGVSLRVNDTTQNQTAQNESFTLNCSVCVPNSGQPGCP